MTSLVTGVGGKDDETSSSSEDGEITSETDQPTSSTNEDPLKQKLSEMTFEELRKFQSDVGTKLFQDAMKKSDVKKSDRQKNYKRENKNRPQEISSKIRVSKIRSDVSVKKSVVQDPRYHNVCGEFDEKLFQKNYGFLDGVFKRDLTTVAKEIKTETDPEKKQKLEILRKKMENKLRTKTIKDKDKDVEEKLRKQRLEQAKKGQKPFYLKNSDKKKMELVEKFKELQKTGKVDKYLAKKRKKNMSRDRKQFNPSK